ncbi:helix-turn-helix domain-containing protein [Rugosimonospora acidiphila]|uniref:Helix-turn-helix domain-containing protein n=1 Tax=Rugosimonospora acidiphila TaxID=556531 RepID=A0ABP9SAW4_9ACTN
MATRSVAGEEDEPQGATEGLRGTGADRSTSQSLDRGLMLMELIGQSPEGISVTELAAATGTHRTIVTRLLKTLARRDYVIRDQFGQYRLGGRLLELARFVQPQVRAAALPILRVLAERISATAHLTMADGDEAVGLIVVEPTTAPFHVAYRVGTRNPLWRYASGIAILCARPVDEVEQPGVALARTRGWAYSEDSQGAIGIAAPLPHPLYSNYCTGVVMLTRPESPDEVGRAVIEAAAAIAARVV